MAKGKPVKPTTSKSTSKTKKMPGKSDVARAKVPVYKPTIYLDDGQIPKDIQGAKVGSTVNFMVSGKVVSKTERSDTSGTNNSVSIEVNKIQPNKKGGKTH